MHFTSAAITALSFCGAASAGVARRFPIVHGARQVPTTLDAAIKAKGEEYVGTALTIRDDPSEEAIITGEFNSITPENAMKWESTEPSRGNFTFDGADAVVEFATANSDEIRCHTLVWYSQLPAWVSSGGFDNATLIGIMETHINAVMGRYKGKCTKWDVVNEGEFTCPGLPTDLSSQAILHRNAWGVGELNCVIALNEDGTYRDNVFLETIGEAYIPISFRLAAAADPGAKLYYNDYNLEYGNTTAKALGAARIVELVQSYGEKLDGVGLQGHMTSEATGTQPVPTPSQDVLEGVLKLYTDLGVEVAYTELDVRMDTPSTPEKLSVQADAYARLVGSCVFPAEGAALVWDENYQKKPAYQAILDTINAAIPTNNTVPNCKRAAGTARLN